MPSKAEKSFFKTDNLVTKRDQKPRRESVYNGWDADVCMHLLEEE